MHPTLVTAWRHDPYLPPSSDEDTSSDEDRPEVLLRACSDSRCLERKSVLTKMIMVPVRLGQVCVPVIIVCVITDSVAI